MSMAARMRRVMVLAKRISAAEHPLHPQMVGNAQDRHRVHEDTIRVCTDALSSRAAHVKFEMHWRDEVQSPIHDVDLVIAVGGDGTLLQASHFVDASVPLLGVNSDPTQTDEVEENLDHFDASRSSGYLCAATASNFEQMLDDILDGTREPVELTRISTSIDGVRIDAPALNDVLIAHPSPAAVSRCSFSIWRQDRGGDFRSLSIKWAAYLHCNWFHSSNEVSWRSSDASLISQVAVHGQGALQSTPQVHRLHDRVPRTRSSAADRLAFQERRCLR